MRLENKVALVTGGAVGIGKAIALLFAREGANVVITYFKHEKEAIETVNQIKELGRNSLAIKFDAKNSFTETVNKTIEEFKKIDILVNNAGIIIPKPFEETTQEIWNQTIHVNLTTVNNCIKEVVPFMKKQNSGKIVNISSIAGIVGSLSSVPYAASKAGVDAITKTLSKGLGKYNIQINSIAPGAVKTSLLLNNYNQEIIDKMASETPLGRVAEPEDIAKVALFFASTESDFVTGQTLIVDGGRIVR
ncbi:MAG: glucose 1-dehydrogenase [archaeon]